MRVGPALSPSRLYERCRVAADVSKSSLPSATRRSCSSVSKIALCPSVQSASERDSDETHRSTSNRWAFAGLLCAIAASGACASSSPRARGSAEIAGGAARNVQRVRLSRCPRSYRGGRADGARMALCGAKARSGSRSKVSRLRLHVVEHEADACIVASSPKARNDDPDAASATGSAVRKWSAQGFSQRSSMPIRSSHTESSSMKSSAGMSAMHEVSGACSGSARKLWRICTPQHGSRRSRVADQSAP